MDKIERMLPRRTASQQTLKPINKLHQAIVQQDITKLKARLNQVRKAKVEICEFDHMDQTPLSAALRLNNIEFVKELLHFYTTSKADINIKDKNGYTALHVAAGACDDQILLLLLNQDGIDVNIPNDDHNSPLHYFCQKFKSPNCQDPFQQFLKKGVNINAKNKNGETPLHKSIFNQSVRLLMVNLLLDAGADVNILNHRSESCLHFAVRLGREDLVSVLMKAGADVTIRGIDNKTAYELARQSSNAKVTHLLKNVQDIYDWLSSLSLEQYWKVFVREEISKDILADLNESILDSMGITATGHRLKILKNCKLLKDGSPSSAPTSKSGDPSMSRKLSPNSMGGPSNHHDGAAPTSSISSNELKETLSSLEHVSINADQWIIEPSEIEYTLKLGAGSSGKVYKGLFKGKEVAVKVLRNITTQEQLEEFKKEFQIMCAIRSPYMVTFYGAGIEQKAAADPKLLLVMEFCSRDSLYHVMNSPKYTIGWDKFFKFAVQMTKGMECLHNWSPQIVHRDFKSLNLLVNEAWDCKVCDFGLSRFNTPENLKTLAQTRGTFAYCAPEVADSAGLPYTTKSDVFSIGIVFWELIMRVVTGEFHRPYSEFTHINFDFQIMMSSKEGLRPTLPSIVPDSLQKLYKACVEQQATNRPSCGEILIKLHAIQNDEYLPNQKQWDSLQSATTINSVKS